MHRSRFDLQLANIEWVATEARPKQPLLVFTFDGPRDRLNHVLGNRVRTDVEAAAIDVSVRFTAPLASADRGVFGLADRVTGDYLLEAEAPADRIWRFLRALREYEARTDSPVQYTVQIRARQGGSSRFEKRRCLVYDADGTLLRYSSLNPTGVKR